MIRLCGNTSARANAVILDVAAPCGGDPFSCSRCCQYTRLLSGPGVPTPSCYSPHRHKGTSSDMCILSISKLCRQQGAWLRIQSQSGAYMCAWSYFWIRIWCSFPHWRGGVVEGGVKGDRNETFPKKAFTLLRLHRLTRQSCFGEAPCNEKHVYSGRT